MTPAVAGLPAACDRSGTARTIALAPLTVELATLAVTGVALYFVYRPAEVSAAADAVRTVHRVTSTITIPTAIVAAILLVIGPTAPLRRGLGLAHAAAIPLVGVMASATGFLLPWRMLGLNSVTVGTDLHGYGPLFGDDVRFVVIGTAAIAPAAVTRWLLVLSPGLIGLTALAWWWTSRGHRRTIA
jgi:hypothetical protein